MATMQTANRYGYVFNSENSNWTGFYSVCITKQWSWMTTFLNAPNMNDKPPEWHEALFCMSSEEYIRVRKKVLRKTHNEKASDFYEGLIIPHCVYMAINVQTVDNNVQAANYIFNHDWISPPLY